MTLWSGRTGEGLAPEVWAFLKAEDAELLPYDCEGTRICTRVASRSAGLPHRRRAGRGRGAPE